MMISSILMALVFFFSSSGGKGIDLLDTVPTEAYWRAKNVAVTVEQLQRDAGEDPAPENVEGRIKSLESGEFATREKARQELERMGPAILPQLRAAMGSKDPEVAAVVGGLVKQFTERGQERSIRRLMAIRTLGERKEQAALPLLRKMMESRELFVSDYAVRAIAAVEGREVEVVSHAKEFEADAALMPRKTGMLGQLIGAGWETLSLSTAIDDAVDVMKGAGGLARQAGEGGGVDKTKLLGTAVKRTLRVLECAGNLRLEGVTVAVSSDVGGDTGWAVVLMRGKYNAGAVADALRLLRSQPPGEAGAEAGAEARAEAGAEAGAIVSLEVDNEMTVLLPSNEVMVLVFGARPAGLREVAAEMTAALKAGKGAVGENRRLVELAAGVRKTGPAWLAAITVDEMKTEKMFAGIDTFTLETTRGKEAVGFTFRGRGEDVEKFNASVAAWKEGIKWTQGVVQRQVQQNPVWTPMGELMDSLKLTEEGKEATMTGEVKPAIRRTLLVEMGMGIMLMLDEGGER